MRMSDTEQLQKEYVEIYNEYMSLPDDHEELYILARNLKDLERKLTIRFLFESGYTLEKVNNNNFLMYIKDGQ